MIDLPGLEDACHSQDFVDNSTPVLGAVQQFLRDDIQTEYGVWKWARRQTPNRMIEMKSKGPNILKADDPASVVIVR